MVMFKMQRGKDGRRDIVQIQPEPSVAEPTRVAKTPKDFTQALEPPVPEKPGKAPKSPEGEKKTHSGSAYPELAKGLYEKGVRWALPLISGLETAEEVAKIHEMETKHPQYKDKSGRVSILDALEERRREFELPNSNPGTAREPEEIPVVVPPAAPGTAECPHCDFVAGSVLGLEAHLEAAHEDEALDLGPGE